MVEEIEEDEAVASAEEETEVGFFLLFLFKLIFPPRHMTGLAARANMELQNTGGQMPGTRRKKDRMEEE